MCNTSNSDKQIVSEEMGGEEHFLTQCDTEVTGDVKSENEYEDFKSKTTLAFSTSLPLSREHMDRRLSDSKEHHIWIEDQCKRAHHALYASVFHHGGEMRPRSCSKPFLINCDLQKSVAFELFSNLHVYLTL